MNAPVTFGARHVAPAVASFLAARPTWAMIQRWLMGTVLGALAVRMALDSRR